MAIALVQAAGRGSSVSATSVETLAFPVPPTVGNYIVAWAWAYTYANPALTLSDTGGNAYTVPAGAAQRVVDDFFNDTRCLIGHARVVTSGSGFKVTLTEPTANTLELVAAEFSGIPATTPQDGTAVGATGSTGTPAPGSMAVSAGSLVVAVAAITKFAAYDPATPSGFTRLAAETDGASSFEVGEAVYAIGPASPSAPAWGPDTVYWAASQFALLAAGAGPPPGSPYFFARQVLARRFS